MARVLQTTLVAPSPSGPERALPLTYLDALWIHASPVERVFYYYPDAAATPDVIAGLKDSLPRALAAFYPLAGRLRLTPGTPNRYELYYQPGDAVTFAVAEYDRVGIDELAAKDGDDPTELGKIVPLVPPLPEGSAVLALQATVLRGGGLALGVTVHHAACDGVSSTHFLHTWAWAAASRTAGAENASAPEPPVIERGFIRDRDDLYDYFVTPRPPTDVVDQDQLLATFTLSKEHLQSVKDTVAREAARHGAPTPRSTSTVAAFGFIWQCYARAKPAGGSEAAAAAEEERSYFLFAADHRARLDVPAKYLGNCVGPCMASAPRKEVSAGGADGLFAACAAVGAAVDHVLRGGPEYWDGWIERIGPAYCAAELPLTVAGSPRFRVYDLDFGFGRPAKVDVVSVGRTGAISVAEERGGGGGLEVGICLAEGGMARFRKSFRDAMASCLSLPLQSGVSN